jgi:hypothetical protein
LVLAATISFTVSPPLGIEKLFDLMMQERINMLRYREGKLWCSCFQNRHDFNDQKLFRIVRKDYISFI